MSGPDRAFYFFVTFWGETFRDNFIDLCARSLLAPGNLPSLPSTPEHRFLISTTREDWEYLQSSHIFPKLQQWISPQWLEISQPPPDCDKYAIMSQAHLKMAEIAFDDDALAVFLCPDALLSDGAISTLVGLARDGKKLVYVTAIRFNEEGIGIIRAKARIKLKNLAYNMRRLVQLEHLATAPP